jgi:hypothetical protein
MISTLFQTLYALFLITVLWVIIKLIYVNFINLYRGFKSFLGVMIEGSENYWKYKWKKTHNTKKVSYENIDKYHSERGWTLTSNLREKLHYGAVINSNSKGVRGIEENYSGKKVLFLGDSFCFGEGVDDNETVPAYFEKNFKNVSAINLGIHGYGIDQQYLYLKESISKYKPNLVCFIITDNDFRRNNLDFRDFAKPKYTSINNQVILTNNPVPTPDDCLKLKKISLHKLFFELVKNFFIFYGFIGKRERIIVSDHILDKIKQTTKENNSELVFIYINDVRRGSWYRSYIDWYFINYFKKNNIKHLYLEKLFGRRKLKNMFDTLSGHFGADANKLIAGKLSESIKSKNILK